VRFNNSKISQMFDRLHACLLYMLYCNVTPYLTGTLSKIKKQSSLLGNVESEMTLTLLPATVFCDVCRQRGGGGGGGGGEMAPQAYLEF